MRRTIIIADKEGLARELLEQIFANDYDIVLADDGKQALAEINTHIRELAAVFIDWDIPGFNGYQILQVLKIKGVCSRVPVILTTDKEETQIEVTGYAMNTAAVIHKPYTAITLRRQVIRLIELFDKVAALEAAAEEKEKKVRQQQEKLDDFYEKLLDSISTIVEYRSPEFERHILRIKNFTRIMAASYKNLYPKANLTDEQINRMVRASAIHDIGKIAVPDSILLKPARLTDDERQVMMSHTTKGVEVLELLRDVQDEEQFKTSYEVCRWHHERHDGKGYPDGLKENEIPLSAKIVSLVDVYDALVSERIYKKAYDTDTAFHMIMKGECGVFAPDILKCFEASRKLIELYAENN